MFPSSVQTIFVALAAVLLFSNGGGVSARRLRTSANRGRYSTAAPLAAEESASLETSSDRISVDTLDQKFAFPDPASQHFKTKPLESDRKASYIS